MKRIAHTHFPALPKRAIAAACLILVVVGCFYRAHAETRQLTTDCTSLQAFQRSCDRIAKALDEKQHKQFSLAIMKIMHDVKPAEGQSFMDSMRQLHGKTFSEIIELAEVTQLDGKAKKWLAAWESTGTDPSYQHDADIMRLRHLWYLGSLIEEYHHKTGRYPLEGKANVANYVYIASPTQLRGIQNKPPEKHVVTSQEIFKDVLEHGLKREVGMTFDPQLIPVNKPNFYMYMIRDDQYFLAVHLHDGEGLGNKLGPHSYKVEVSNRRIPSARVAAYYELVKRDGFRKRACDNFTRRPPRNPEQADIYAMCMEAGARNQKEKDLAAAWRDYSDALRLNPLSPTARFNMGLVYLTGKDWKNAQIAFQQTIRLNPRDGESWYHLAVARFRSGAGVQAIADYDKAVELGFKDKGHFGERLKPYRTRRRHFTYTPLAGPAKGQSLLLHGNTLGDDRLIQDALRSIELLRKRDGGLSGVTLVNVAFNGSTPVGKSWRETWQLQSDDRSSVADYKMTFTRTPADGGTDISVERLPRKN